jgi:Mg/Co/Ni transporter MgtE
MNTRQEKREIASRKIKESLDQNNFREAVDLFLDLLPGDQVEIFEILDDDDQDLIVAHLDITSTADLFDVLEDSETLEAAEGLSIERLADILVSPLNAWQTSSTKCSPMKLQTFWGTYLQIKPLKH